MKINQEKCYVDKRRLILDCDIAGKNYRFTLDDWDYDNNVRKLEIDGKVAVVRSGCETIGNPEDWPPFAVINSYKHCVQVAFGVDEDRQVFIDRRYEHNNSFDVYYNGKHYLVYKELDA